MIDLPSPGKRFRSAVEANDPLQVVGTVNAYSAIMAQKLGHQAIYLSGDVVAVQANGEWKINKVSMSRSARVLMEGKIRVPVNDLVK